MATMIKFSYLPSLYQSSLYPTYLSDMFVLCNTEYDVRNSRNRLSLPKPRTEYLKRSFSYSGARKWNTVPEGVNCGARVWNTGPEGVNWDLGLVYFCTTFLVSFPINIYSISIRAVSMATMIKFSYFQVHTNFRIIYCCICDGLYILKTDFVDLDFLWI